MIGSLKKQGNVNIKETAVHKPQEAMVGGCGSWWFSGEQRNGLGLLINKTF